MSAASPETCSYPSIEESPASQAHRQSLANVSLPRVPCDSIAAARPLSNESPHSQGLSEYSEVAVDSFSSLRSLDTLPLETDVYSAGYTSNNINVENNFEIFNGTPMTSGNELDFRWNGLDWLDFDIPDVELAIDLGAGLDVGIVPPVSNLTHSSIADESLLSPRPSQTRRPGLPWPFEQGQDVTSARYPLPPLHDVLQSTLRSSSGTKSRTFAALAHVLSGPKVPRAEDVNDADTALGTSILQQLLDGYFSTFQMIQPIIHAPTFRMAESPTILVAPMACIAAVLSSRSDAAEFSSSLSDFCISMITWLGVADVNNYSDFSYLTSLCLHQIYSLGSGNRQLYQNADRTRGVLIGSLRGLGLLKSRPSIGERFETSLSTESLDVDSNAEWLAWASRERDIRLAWASFEYDCSLCTLTGRRGAVDLSELPARLPSDDCLWNAPSASAWIALRARSDHNAQGASLSSVLGSLIAEKSIRHSVSTWGRRLCGQVIGRLLWDLKQLEIVSTTEFFNLSSLRTGQQQSKSSLLESLDCLIETMNQPKSAADLVSYNILNLLCHYSHLYAADDIMDMILYIVRSVASKVSVHDRGVDLARQRLVSEFKKDRVRARALIWHSGQIIAVAKEYLVSAPCEIMRLFMSYIFIITFIKYFPHDLEAGAEQAVRLDVTSHQTGTPDSVLQWIQTGGCAIIGSAVIAPGSSKAIIQDAQVMFKSFRAWGLAEKFAKILQCFEMSDSS